MAPPEIYQRLASRWPALRARASELAADASAGTAIDASEAAVVRRSAELDAMTLSLAQEVSDRTTDLTVVYLPGLDIAQHTLLGAGAAGMPSASAVSAKLAALDAYYVALDRLLSDIVSPSAQELFVLVTAPGRVTAGPNGRLMMRGPAARASASITAQATDVAPTLLYALGVPISGEIAGRPLLHLFSESFVSRYAIREVATYGRPTSRPAQRGQPLDQEMIDRLRSLGYLK
jgi:hypothetical protein